MKVLWAPWRMAYIQSSRKPVACIFCTKVRERRDSANLILYRSRHAFVVMNLFPYNTGHLLITPYAHVADLDALIPEAALDLFALTNLSVKALRLALHPEGFNIGINLGRVSGAGIDSHLHLHIVPRWNGDTNFMPLFSEVRVMPEHLGATYRKLRQVFRRLGQDAVVEGGTSNGTATATRRRLPGPDGGRRTHTGLRRPPAKRS
ncbi:HIT family protein [Candidatus Nitrospira bockiana]